jgi:single-strand DNA-binding protein
MAVNRKFTTKSGDKRDETLYIDCEMWGKRAGVINQYLSKGDPILVTGFLKQDTWETEGGDKRSKIYVSVQDFEFISTKSNNSKNSTETKEPELSDVPF